jgi:plasmid stabilization system protein ParE
LVPHPYLGPARPDLRAEARMLTYRRRAVIIYSVHAETVVILRVFYGGADYAAIMQDDD